MRRIIGCTEVQGCWPLDLMTKLEGSPYRADYSGKGPFIIDGSSLGAPHILHFPLYSGVFQDRAVQTKDLNYSNIRLQFYRIFGYSGVAKYDVKRAWQNMTSSKL